MFGIVAAAEAPPDVAPAAGDATPVGASDGPMVGAGDAADAQAAARVEQTNSNNAN